MGKWEKNDHLNIFNNVEKPVEEPTTEITEPDIKVMDENPNSVSLMYELGKLWGNSLPGLWFRVKKQNLRLTKKSLQAQLENNKEGKDE